MIGELATVGGSARVAVAHRYLPSAGGRYFARSGGLLGYSADIRALFRRPAAFVHKILDGAKLGELPIEQATNFKTILNLKASHTLGLEIPPDMLAAADEVIE